MSDINQLVLSVEMGHDVEVQNFQMYKVVVTAKSSSNIILLTGSDAILEILETIDSGTPMIVIGELRVIPAFDRPVISAIRVIPLNRAVDQVNTITLTGRLGRDMETKFTPEWQIISNSLAVSGYRQGVRTTDWISVRTFTKADDPLKGTDLIFSKQPKGALIGVSGTVNFSESNDKTYANVTVNRLSLFSKSNSSEIVF